LYRATYGVVWLECQFLSHAVCFLCLKSQNRVGILNGFHCDHFGSVESESVKSDLTMSASLIHKPCLTVSICQETNNGKCLSLFNLVYCLIFHHHVITCSASYTTFLFQLTSPSQFETPLSTQFTSGIWQMYLFIYFFDPSGIGWIVGNVYDNPFGCIYFTGSSIEDDLLYNQRICE